MTEDKKPIFEQRVGSVRLSVWKNEDKDRNTFHNVTIVRRYKSGDDDWSNSNSYTGLSDLALLGEAVELAREYLRDVALGAAKEAS